MTMIIIIIVITTSVVRKDLILKTKAKDLALKAKDLTFKAKAKAKDLTSSTQSKTALKMFSVLDLGPYALQKWSLNLNYSFFFKIIIQLNVSL